MKEMSRQLVHLSGILFIVLVQFLDSLAAAAVFFMLAIMFLFYAFYVMRERNRFERFLDFLERHVRKTAMNMERPGIPFRGAFWFYFGCGIAFLMFPKEVATAATLILAISDSLSTLVGYHFGRFRLLEGKTVEGTLSFMVSALAIAFFLGLPGFFLGAIAATAGEMLPGLPGIRGLRERGLIDDNFLIPVLAGAFLLL